MNGPQVISDHVFLLDRSLEEVQVVAFNIDFVLHEPSIACLEKDLDFGEVKTCSGFFCLFGWVREDLADFALFILVIDAHKLANST